MSERKVEVRTPLFDRLVDRDPFLRHELRPMRTLDRRGLKESVRRELEQLFNTRCPIPAHRLGSRRRSVVDYGIPDFSTFFTRNQDDWQRVAAILQRAIEIYEPRLAQVRVTVERDAGEEFVFRATIEAVLLTENVPEPVSFVTLLQTREGSAEVHAALE
ncbi:MAG TPA: type VI secretion system baseplate subunit TssE [Thermoanaerobaculia bacterium]|jgi:type VI secretion system lysozyme-like protein|nr:type VI secretion system baseplate subunit TssE [Thermoanaerobaculia bacterium]